MEFFKYLRIYVGYGLVYVSYTSAVYVLDKLFTMVDDNIKTDLSDVSNNINLLSDSTDGVITTHDFRICEKVLNLIKMRGGENSIIFRTASALVESLKHTQRFCDKLISIMIKPIADTIGYLLLKFPVFNNLYSTLKRLKVILALAAATAAVRMVARFDYWALVICRGLHNTGISEETALSSIRRIRMGKNYINICSPDTEFIIQFVTDEQISLEKKANKFRDIFLIYESFPEGHQFKNSYFVCLIKLLLALFFARHWSFKFAIRILFRMLENGQISLQTYREVVVQLLAGGASKVDIEIV